MMSGPTLLALESSTETCSVALLHQGRVLERIAPPKASASERMLPMVAELMAEVGLGYANLDAIAFGAGPGAFTGLRLACGMAQGLGLAHETPLLPVVTLEALALEAALDAAPQSTLQSQPLRLLAALDARMGELYLAAYEVGFNAELRVLMPPTLAKPEALPDCRSVDLIIGSGGDAHPDALFKAYAVKTLVPQRFPRAAWVAKRASSLFAKGETVRADDAAPIYLRNKVALNVTEQAAARMARENAVKAA
jgi:tRNA threonylcarbamoyladenosine biosynthesis protein TsaB